MTDSGREHGSREEPGQRRRLSRGTFVKTLGTVIAGSALLPLDGAVASAHSLARPAGLRGLGQAAFAARIGEKFTIRHGSSTTVARLLSVTDLPQYTVTKTGTRVPVTNIECFSLVFRTADARSLAQGTYRLHNKHLGTFSLLIVPGKVNGHARNYEAIINRLGA